MADHVAGHNHVATLSATAVDTVTLDSVRQDLNSAVEWVIVENLDGAGGADLWARADGETPVADAADSTLIPAGEYRAIRPAHQLGGVFEVAVVGDGQRYQVRSV
jgi:hypothetical protein